MKDSLTTRTPQAQADYETLLEMLTHVEQLQTLSKRGPGAPHAMCRAALCLAQLQRHLLAAVLEVEG